MENSGTLSFAILCYMPCPDDISEVDGEDGE